MGLDNSYEIYLPSNLEEIIRKNLPQELRKVFDRKIKYLSRNIFYPSLNTKKYSVGDKTLSRLGVDEIWEFYINRRDYRCIFYVIHETKKIIIADIGTHDQLKRKYTS